MLSMNYRALCLGLLCLIGWACREEKSNAVREVEPQKVVAARVDLDLLRGQFQNLEAPDSSRLRAGRALLDADGQFLVEHYGQRDNARIVRGIIEERVARREKSVLPLLVDLFARVEGEERIDFEVYLLRFGRESEAQLIELLRAQDAGLVMRTLDALGKMQAVGAVDSIAACLQRDDAWIRMGAAHALGDIGDRRAIGPLVATLQDTAYAVVNAALVGLGRLGAVEVYDEIAALLHSDNAHVRKHAAIALGELGDRRALAAVRQLAEEDVDAGVRFMASKALEKLEEKP